MSFFNPSRFCRVTLSLCAIFGGAVTYVDNGNSVSDPINYFNTYKSLISGDSSALFTYNNGFEIVMPSLWFVAGKIFGDISLIHFSMFNSITFCLLFLLWFEKYGCKEINSSDICICLFLILLMLNYQQPAFVVRQLYSMVFVLFALSQKKKTPMLFFLLLAEFTHATAIIFFTIFYLLRHHKKLGFLLCISICLFFVSSNFLIILVDNMHIFPDLIANKIPYYSRLNLTDFLGDYGHIKYIIRSSLFLLFLIITCLIYRQYVSTQWKYIILGYSLVLLFTTFLNHYHFLERIAGFFYSVLSGFLIFVVSHKNKVLIYFICIVLFLFKLINIFLPFTYVDLVAEGYAVYYGLCGSFFYYLLQ